MKKFPSILSQACLVLLLIFSLSNIFHSFFLQGFFGVLGITLIILFSSLPTRSLSKFYALLYNGAKEISSGLQPPQNRDLRPTSCQLARCHRWPTFCALCPQVKLCFYGYKSRFKILYSNFFCSRPRMRQRVKVRKSIEFCNQRESFC